jgi:hypothetical protein
MATNKTNPETAGIDEAFLLQSIKKQDDEPKEKKPEAKETRDIPDSIPEKPKEGKESVKRRRNVNTGYCSQFLKRNDFKARQCVYISQRIHAAVSEIVRIISDRDITVGGYIDSILTEHLDTHRDEITELYNSELSKKYDKNPLEF